jgi:hypothetical protein
MHGEKYVILIKVIYCQDHRVSGKTTWRGDRETYHTRHLPSLHARTLRGDLLYSVVLLFLHVCSNYNWSTIRYSSKRKYYIIKIKKKKTLYLDDEGIIEGVRHLILKKNLIFHQLFSMLSFFFT